VSAPLLSEQSDGVTRLSLNRPDKGNALDVGLVEALIQAVEAAMTDGTRLLVLTGTGKSFCSGLDLFDLDALSDADLCHRAIRIETLLQAVHYAPFATLGFAHGKVFGAGADLFCCCSRRIAAPDTSFRMPGLGFGLVLGTARFADRVGIDGARAIQQETRSFSATEAEAIGFVNALQEPSDWPAEQDRQATAARTLTPEALAALYEVTAGDSPAQRRDRDMAELARSASRPGIKDRIRAYREAVRKAAGKS